MVIQSMNKCSDNQNMPNSQKRHCPCHYGVYWGGRHQKVVASMRTAKETLDVLVGADGGPMWSLKKRCFKQTSEERMGVSHRMSFPEGGTNTWEKCTACLKSCTGECSWGRGRAGMQNEGRQNSMPRFRLQVQWEFMQHYDMNRFHQT